MKDGDGNDKVNTKQSITCNIFNIVKIFIFGMAANGVQYSLPYNN